MITIPNNNVAAKKHVYINRVNGLPWALNARASAGNVEKIKTKRDKKQVSNNNEIY